MENSDLKWMITGGTPMDWTPPSDKDHSENMIKRAEPKTQGSTVHARVSWNITRIGVSEGQRSTNEYPARLDAQVHSSGEAWNKWATGAQEGYSL